MDVWMTWAKRKAKCRYCGELVVKATPMVTGKLWRKGNPESRKINIRFYWHPQCWIKQGLDYLKEHPYYAGNRGRKKLNLTPEESKLRYKLLRKYAALRQRITKLASEYPDNVLPILRIEKQMAETAKEIKKVGGIPAKWDIK